MAERCYKGDLMNVRNKGLDCLKCLCAFLVVCVHKRFPGEVGMYITALARMAVPVFFMITGYFYSQTAARQGEKRQIIKILKLVVISNLFYCLWSGFISVTQGGKTFGEYLSAVINKQTLFEFAVLNESPFRGHLWYLSALLYVLVIVLCVHKAGKTGRKALYCLIPVLLLADLIFGKYSVAILGKKIPYIYVRNFLCVGLPYFCIGDYIRQRELSGKSGKRNLVLLGGMIPVFWMTTLAERFLLRYYKVNAPREHYISTTFLAVAAFLFFLEYGKRNRGGKIFHWTAAIGLRYSLMIYLIHPAIVTYFHLLVKKKYFPLAAKVYLTAPPVFIFLAALIFAVCFYWITGMFSGKKNNRKNTEKGIDIHASK